MPRSEETTTVVLGAGENVDGVHDAGWLVNQTNAGFLDLRMRLQLLQWLQNEQAFESASLRRAFKQTLAPTCWVSVYSQLTAEAPPEAMKQRAERTRAELMQLNGLITPLVSCMVTVAAEQSGKGPASVLDRRSAADWAVWWAQRQQQQQQPAAGAAAESSFSAEALAHMVRVGDIFLSFGELLMARNNFWTYLDVVCDFVTEARDDMGLRIRAAWGYLVASLALLPEQLAQQKQFATAEAAWEAGQQWARIAQVIVQLDQWLEQQKLPPQEVLMQQVWLLHAACWALCLYYLPRLAAVTRESPRRPVIAGQMDWLKVLDYLVSERSVTVMRSCCPHLLRYVAATATVNRRKESIFQSALEAVRMASPASEGECFTALLEALFIHFDFPEAQRQLAHCQDAAKKDFMLVALAAALEENCQLMVFETHCRTQKSICIDSMAKQLNMTPETAERWVVDLIRHSSLAAKIDSERRRVEITTPTPNPYQQPAADSARWTPARPE